MFCRLKLLPLLLTVKLYCECSIQAMHYLGMAKLFIAWIEGPKVTRAGSCRVHIRTRFLKSSNPLAESRSSRLQDAIIVSRCDMAIYRTVENKKPMTLRHARTCWVPLGFHILCVDGCPASMLPTCTSHVNHICTYTPKLKAHNIRDVATTD